MPEEVDEMNNDIPPPINKTYKLPNSKNAQKTILEEGDKSGCFARQGSTGELSIVLNSITGLDKNTRLPDDITYSKYFNTEKCESEFEIGLSCCFDVIFLYTSLSRNC